MPAVDKLLLEEALQDSPQTRSLLSVFEEDAGTLTDYTNQLLQAMQRVYGAQVSLLPLTESPSGGRLPSSAASLRRLRNLEEVSPSISPPPYSSVCHMQTSLPFLASDASVAFWDSAAENEMCLATQQLSKQLLAYEKQNFALGKGDEEVISTLHYFSKVVDEVKTEVVKEVAAARRKQHLSSLQYYCALNALQYRKRMAMMEPMLGFAHGQINFFKKGAAMFSQNMDNFLSSVSDMVQSIQVELEAEAEKMRVSQQELLSVDEAVYTPDFDVAAPQINRNLIQKAGYLNLRSKTGLVTTSWERLYFFTQGGNLMCQPRGAVAGGLIQDLDNCSVMAVDCEDRRYCFQITTPNGKSGIILQAESRKENEEWICAINNISRQIYLTDNPEAVAIKLNETALQAVTPITGFRKKQESPCPSPNLENSEVKNDNTVPKATVSVPEAEELIAPGTPIQFDIVLPATEFLDQNRGSRRTNPFGETEDDAFPEAEDSLLQQMFIVRFLGSMAVKTDGTTEVIYEAMRQVLAARAIHNIFRMTESHLMVTSQMLRLIDPQTQVSRANFDLTSVTQFAAHQENKRLVGFVVRLPESTGGESLSTYVFESNSEGEKICYAINLGKEINEVQKDPEALAQLMLSIPLTNDGKYVLLNDQPEDTDGSPRENAGAESEA
ncbi:DCC-interacting protein 13-beta isoform X6 [Pipistrellus kuhlii]|uniref:DCC-interacting protein 13-beta isoform X6 n=1 Tax=Pipistrellus kuhlii TaxID=59472 RepID=UPI00174F2816|nr:DCC-interacting protein 13-beta isoform X6 [Pipistrellus kuhlii]